MNIQDRFLAYADAFELSYEDNDWSRLAQYFTEHASYDSGDDTPASGRDAVLAKLEGAVDGMDRKMDSRKVEFQPPTTRGDTVVVEWTASYTRAGVPDLAINGTEYARFEGDRIAELRDEFAPGTMEMLGAWFSEHGHALGG
jgi:hypothetical protein